MISKRSKLCDTDSSARVTESDAESVTDDDRQPHNTKGYIEMINTTKEQRHREEVDEIINSVGDHSLIQEMKDTATIWRMTRYNYFAAINTTKQIAEQQGLDLDESITKLREALAEFRAQELITLSMIASLDERSRQAV